MNKLIELNINSVDDGGGLPYSVYRSYEEQNIINVPIIKPLLVVVLSGEKELVCDDLFTCPAGSFVFLSNAPDLAMRNIPVGSEYCALLIEFEYSDFDCFDQISTESIKYFKGPVDTMLEYTLQQFVEWSEFSTSDLWHIRRKEILQVMASRGFGEVMSIMNPPSLSHRIQLIISSDLENDLDARAVSTMLAMSESTLRRKLSDEGHKFQDIKDRARLGRGLHLVQTSSHSIGRIAELCGYSSQSRFTDKFKQLFNTTPTDLRRTRMIESGE